MTETDPKTAYLEAARRLMQQLAQGGLRLGLSYGMMEAALRDATLEAAHQQAEKAGSKVTTSSLHVATGIHRREISRWLNERDQESKVAPLGNDSPSARVVARWSTNRSYIHEDGTPILLPMAKRNDGSSFAQLVEEIGPEVRAKSVLEGLIAAGLVEDLEDGRYRLSTAAYLPEANSRESIGFLAANVGDHLAGAIHNIAASPEDRFFERAYFDDSVTAEGAAWINGVVSDSGMQMLQNMMGLMNQTEPVRVDKGNVQDHRVRIGVYCYSEKNDA